MAAYALNFMISKLRIDYKLKDYLVNLYGENYRHRRWINYQIGRIMSVIVFAEIYH